MGQNKHRPGHHFASERPDFGVATVVPAPGKVEAWQKVWKLQSLQRMWTPADLAHAGNLRFSAKLQLLGPDNPFPLSLSLSLSLFFFCSVLLCLLPQLPHPLGKVGPDKAPSPWTGEICNHGQSATPRPTRHGKTPFQIFQGCLTFIAHHFLAA